MAVIDVGPNLEKDFTCELLRLPEITTCVLTQSRGIHATDFLAIFGDRYLGVQRLSTQHLRL